MAYKAFYKKRINTPNIADIISFFYIIEEGLQYADENTSDGFIVLENAPTGYAKDGIYYHPYYNLTSNEIFYESQKIETPESETQVMINRIKSLENQLEITQSVLDVMMLGGV